MKRVKTPDVLGSRRKTQNASCVCLEPTVGGIRSFNLKSSTAIQEWYAKDVPLIGAAKTAAAARQTVCGDGSLNGYYRCGIGREQER